MLSNPISPIASTSIPFLPLQAFVSGLPLHISFVYVFLNLLYFTIEVFNPNASTTTPFSFSTDPISLYFFIYPFYLRFISFQSSVLYCRSLSAQLLRLQPTLLPSTARLQVSQFPVFTLYAQKVCVPAGEPKCLSPWAYESVPDLALDPIFSESDERSAASKSECIEMCLEEEEFSCRYVMAHKGMQVLNESKRDLTTRTW